MSDIYLCIEQSPEEVSCPEEPLYLYKTAPCTQMQRPLLANWDAASGVRLYIPFPPQVQRYRVLDNDPHRSDDPSYLEGLPMPYHKHLLVGGACFLGFTF